MLFFPFSCFFKRVNLCRRYAAGVADDARKVKPLEQRLERFDRHTRHCRHCKEALKELGVLEERCVDFSNGVGPITCLHSSTCWKPHLQLSSCFNLFTTTEATAVIAA
jgi:hypothetical protein